MKADLDRDWPTHIRTTCTSKGHDDLNGSMRFRVRLFEVSPANRGCSIWIRSRVSPR